MVAYEQTEISFDDIHRRQENEALVIERRVAGLRAFFEREHPDYRTLPYIVAQRVNTERQIIEVRICAPADEELAIRARTGDRSWSMKQFMVVT